MKTRTVALYRSLRNIAALIDAHPALRAHASESKAFELFVAVLADFEALHHEQQSTRRELKQFAAEKKRLTERIHLMIQGLRATADLVPKNVALAPFSTPSTKLTTYRFSLEAIGIVDATAKHAAAFIDSGLHPRAFDETRALIIQLIEIDNEEMLTQRHAASFNIRLNITIDTARKRRRQLELDLRRAMTPEIRAAWRSAAALGRTHRPKQLPAGAKQKLLAAPNSGDPEGDAGVSPANRGITTLARRVRLRLTRGVPA
jgi:hypothetical protein